ncbi:MAG: hypothetical protein U0894_05620 [Pirellulales bacterium]
MELRWKSSARKQVCQWWLWVPFFVRERVVVRGDLVAVGSGLVVAGFVGAGC